MMKKVKVIILFLVIIICILASMYNLNDKNKTIYKNFITGQPEQPLTCTTEECILSELGKTMEQKNVARVWFIAQEHLLPFYGNAAGIPQDYQEINYMENKYEVIPISELQKEYLKYWDQIKSEFNQNGQFRDGRIPILRDYIKNSINLLYYVKADVKNKKEVIEFSTKVADYLVSIQSSTGVFGTPDLRNIPEKELQKYEQLASVSLKMIRDTQLKEEQSKNCIYENCFEIINGSSWQIYHHAGGLQFDNGLVLAFLSMLYKETSSDPLDWNFAPNRNKYINSAIRSANWIKGQNCIHNFNYNSFSAYGLAYLYEATKDEHYLNLAIEKMKLGVFPGTIPDGYFNDWRDGRFMDAHNAKNVYHWIIVRAGITILAFIPQTHPDYEFIKYYSNLTFQSGINEIEEFGVYKTSPAHEIAFYCSHFDCDENIKNSLTSTMYWNYQSEKDPVGIYYFYRKIRI